MRNFKIWLACPTLAVALIGAGACGDDGDTTSASASESASASASATAGTDSATDSASASATDSASGSDSASASASETASASATTTDTTDSATTDTTTTDTTDTAGGDACEPEGDDDECSMCLKQPTADGGCCDELSACRANADCTCLIDCLDEMGMGIDGLEACQGQCSIEGLPPGGIELSACQAANCEAC